MAQPLASTSAHRLDTLPQDEPSNAASTARNAEDTAQAGVQLEGQDPDADSEPIPSLSSLLLSTAASLASRSTSDAPTSAAAAPAKSGKLLAGVGRNAPAPTAVTLSTSPEALLSHPAAPPYLASLLAQPLKDIEALPASLASLSSTLDQDLSSLAYTRYAAFLQSHAAAQSISGLFTTLSDSLAALLDATASLEQEATAFGSKIGTVRDKRERMARVRDRITEVEELLDAPSVVDACVRAGYWSEAIDVATRLEKLHRRLLTGSGSSDGRGARALLDRIRGEVNTALLSLRTRVLESLVQRTLKLPGAVRAIGVLRRITERGLAVDARQKPKRAGANGIDSQTPALDEDALRVVFLVARWRCLRSELGGVEAQMTAAGIQLAQEGEPGATPAKSDMHVSAEENEERARWTKRWIEVWREIVGETITMYAEVFAGHSTSSAAADGSPEMNGDKENVVKSHASSPVAPLHLFLSTALDSLSSILARAIAGLNSAAALSSLVTQLAYCSHSFARYGLDFRQVIQLRERVELRIGRIVALDLEAAGRKWEKEWRDAWGHSGGAVMTAARARRTGRVPLTDWLIVPEGLSTALSTPVPPTPTTYDLPSADSWHPQPSASIALFPPLARFLNAHATALNALRLFPPVSLYQPLRRAQAVELDRATQVLSAFADAWLAAVQTTPILGTPGLASANATPMLGGGDDVPSTDEQTISRERDEESRAVAGAIAWFGRGVVTWCAAALERGVYAEFVASGRAGDEAVAEGVKEAQRRCEKLVAKIEGREYVEPTVKAEKEDDSTMADKGEAPAAAEAGNVQSPPPPTSTELPVIDPDAPVSTAPSSITTPTALTPDLTALNGGVASKPAEFLIPALDGLTAGSSTDVMLDAPAATGEADGADVPYVVHEKAPPPPVRAEGDSLPPSKVSSPIGSQ